MREIKKVEAKQYHSILLTENEVKQRVKNTPKIDVKDLLKHGYVEAKKFHNDLENGLL